MSRRYREGDLTRSRDRKKQLDKVFAKYEGICQKCFKPTPRDEATRGHIIACQFGGTAEDSNIQLECFTCNNSEFRQARQKGRNKKLWKTDGKVLFYTVPTVKQLEGIKKHEKDMAIRKAAKAEGSRLRSEGLENEEIKQKLMALKKKLEGN